MNGNMKKKLIKRMFARFVDPRFQGKTNFWNIWPKIMTQFYHIQQLKMLNKCP